MATTGTAPIANPTLSLNPGSTTGPSYQDWLKTIIPPANTKGPTWYQNLRPVIIWGAVGVLATVALSALIGGNAPSQVIAKQGQITGLGN